MEFADSFIEIFNNEINYFIVCILILSGIFEIFIVLILLEIIELEFCGLNYNTKRNIRKRALIESNLSNEKRTPTEETALMDE